jgi:peptidoglycan/LPS O-acetylase OafA/YrhL
MSIRPKTSRKRVAGLDIIRFVAAALVMFYHLGTGKEDFPELFGVSWSGFVGVEIFFVISGFAITYSAASASALSFLRSRIVRLYPAVWICATVSVATVWTFNLESPLHLLHGYFNSLVLFPFRPWADGVYWTLGIEMAFYAAIFCLLAVKSFHRISIVCYVLGGASAVYWLLGTMVVPSFLRDHLWSRPVELSLISYGIFFALGILLYSAQKSGFSPALVAFSTVLMIAAVVEIHYKAAHNNLIFHSAEPEALSLAIFFVAIAAMVASLRWKVSPPTASVLRIVGLATYPLYLIHDNFGKVALNTLLDRGFNRYVALGAAVSLCIVSSFLVAIILEPPIQRVIRMIFDRGISARHTLLPSALSPRGFRGW